MRSKPARIKSVLHVNELLALVPDSLYSRLSEEFKADKWVQKLHASVLFKLILYSIFHSERLSLRVMESLYAQADFQVLAGAVGKTAHNSIRDRLRTVSVGYFEAIYAHFYQAVAALYGEQELEHKYHLRRFDSTMVSTFSHYLDGIRVGNSSGGKVQVKFTVEYRDTFLLRAQLHTEQRFVSEERALGQALRDANVQSDEVLIFDRGVKSRATLETLSEQGKFFVTRLQKTSRYDLIEELPVTQTPNEQNFCIQRHAKVYLYQSGQKRHDTPYYLVQSSRHNGQSVTLLTNLAPEQASAQCVAQLYAQRWDIEVLFRFLKQEMNLKHFVCHDPNACAVMLYGLLIAATMILLYKKHNDIPSFKQAKILFVKELVNAIIYDMLQTPEGIEQMKRLFKPQKRE